MEYNIRPARKDDAPFISETILTALGEESVKRMAGEKDRMKLVEEVFTNLAGMEDSQYSYLNTLIAVTPEGDRAGAIINYDGADLYPLRKAFIREANRILGWNLEESQFTDETTPEEIYIDSIMVLPKYRRHGLASRLINEVIRKAEATGKPVGLLVDYHNDKAATLYSKLGFKSVGCTMFAGKEMDHRQCPAGN